MRGRIRRIDKLAGDEAVFDLFCQLICLGDRAGHALCAVGEHQLSAVGLEHITALNAHCLGHGQDDAVAFGCRDSRKADAGVAAGRLDDGRARLERATFLGLCDHCIGDAVLDRTCRIKILKFGQDARIRAGFCCKFVCRVQRGVADQLGKAVLDICHRAYRLSNLLNS